MSVDHIVSDRVDEVSRFHRQLAADPTARVARPTRQPRRTTNPAAAIALALGPPVGDALDNAVADSFFASLQCELLDRHTWPTRAGLAQAMFHWIEAFYNPTRRHCTLGDLSPVDFETSTVA